MFCSKCGVKLEKDARFCKACGADQQVAAVDTSMEPATVGPTAQRRKPEPPPGSRMRTLGIGCLALVGLVVLAVVIAAIARPATPTATTAAVSFLTPTAVTGDAATSALTKPTAVPPKPTGASQGTATNPFPLGVDVEVADVQWLIESADRHDTLPDIIGRPKPAQGVYIVVLAAVQNNGKEPKTLSALNLVDSQGRKFTAAPGPFTIAPATVIFQTLNPGLPLAFSTVFDVPKDATGLMVTVSNLALLGPKLAYVSLDKSGP